jgi:signal transduction histidine kinase
LLSFSAGERERVDVAPIDPRLQYFGSDSLMLFVVFNLLKNALHATTGGTTGRIEILAERDDGSCVLQIRDTGTGIDANVLPHIFDPFYSTKSHGRGAGLGLAYCRRVCEMFGGQISCESVPGVMTTFTIRLPEAGSPASRR